MRECVFGPILLNTLRTACSWVWDPFCRLIVPETEGLKEWFSIFCFQEPLPKHLLLKDLVSRQLNDFLKWPIKMTLFLHVLINHRWMCLPGRLLRSTALSVPTKAGTMQPWEAPADISVDLWGLMTDNVLLPLGFLKHLNTLWDLRHPVYPPREQCFEVQKMMVKVANKGWVHLGPRNLAFEETLRKE